jgi:hypothetical protein
MEEETTDEGNLDDYTQKRVKEGIEDLLQEKELKIKWRKEIENYPNLDAFFEPYYDNSKKSFIDHYLTVKHSYTKHGDSYGRILERKHAKWINEAHEQLEAILQKKLFDLQCLWRANQVKLEGVQICYDFKIWKEDIFSCPFLEPITDNDIKMYQEFLNQGNLGLRDLTSLEWQDYIEIKEEYLNQEDGFYMPDWYSFHNLRTGNSSLLLLPDTRGEMEEFYMTLRTPEKEAAIKKAESLQPVEEKETKMFLNYFDDNVIKEFVDTFEDELSKKRYANYSEVFSKKRFDLFEYNDLCSNIEEINEPIPVGAHHDLKEAMQIAYTNYCLKKIADHLPIAHEQYLLNKQMGFTVNKEEEDEFERPDLRKMYIDAILRGRERNGEERTLDF